MSERPLRIGIIGGSGLGDALAGEAGRVERVDTPFGPPSSGITLATWQGVEVAMLKRHGDGHVFNPSSVPYRANIFALKKLGVTHIIASGATGSLREHISPGDIVIADQVIDKTHKRANTFYERAAVHVEFSEPFCPVMREWLLAAGERIGSVVKKSTDPHPNPLPQKGEGIRVHDGGTYFCMEGPAFSTRAESHMHRAWGGDLIGMTCMPEAKLAREAEIAYALVGLPTDFDCWKPHPPGVPQHELLKEIIGNLQLATQRSITLIKAALADVSLLREKASPAHAALAMAIWTEKAKIDLGERNRLRPLWGKYL